MGEARKRLENDTKIRSDRRKSSIALVPTVLNNLFYGLGITRGEELNGPKHKVISRRW